MRCKVRCQVHLTHILLITLKSTPVRTAGQNVFLENDKEVTLRKDALLGTSARYLEGKGFAKCYIFSSFFL